MDQTILLVNGPNLNMLGTREKDIYGTLTLDEIVRSVTDRAREKNRSVRSLQSNDEGAIVSFIQQEGRAASGMLLNAGALTHTSIAVRDAVLSVRIPFVEVPLSNIVAREEFRHKSYLSDIAVGVVCGFGPASYALALDGLIDFLERKK